MNNFHGVKIALLYQNQILIYLRDNKPGLVFAGQWDLPGGGREGSESPEACAVRETREEFGFTLDPQTIVWKKEYPSSRPQQTTWFLVAPLAPEQLANISFGSEGQRWKLMPIAEYLELSDGVGPLQDRLREYLASITPSKL